MQVYILQQLQKIQQKHQSALQNYRLTGQPYLKIPPDLLETFLETPHLYSLVMDLETFCLKPLCQQPAQYPEGFVKDLSLNFFLENVVHPAYLLPYCVSADTSYQLFMTLTEQFFQHSTQISLPMKFPNDEHFYWYTQYAIISEATQTYQPVQNISVYATDKRRFYEFERQLLAPRALKDGFLIEPYHSTLQQQMKQIFIQPFLETPKWQLHLIILTLHCHFWNDDYNVTGNELTFAKQLGITPPYLKLLKTELLQMLRHQGLDYFKTFQEWAEYIQEADLIPLNPHQKQMVPQILDDCDDPQDKRTILIRQFKNWGIF
jgi:hypothetical protein